MKRWIAVMAMTTAGCVHVSRSVHTVDFENAPVPSDRVEILLPGDAVAEGCVRVADLSVSSSNLGPPALISRLRSEAGKVGANGVQILTMEPPGLAEEFLTALVAANGDIDADAVAFHCPSPGE